MPISDPQKRELARRKRLYFKICMDCNARNPPSATQCRKCRKKHLRWKKREVSGK